MKNKIQVKAVIIGRVQGVCYRASTKEAADSLGIKGHVKNLPDSSVEAVFQGDKPLVDQMIEWCRKGPAAARVEQVRTQATDNVSDYTAFEIRY